jgi:predicted HAD superfamily Cof-like phosphohydrolase
MSDSDITKTMEFFSKAFPSPVSKNLHTQLGVHYEEIAEFTRAFKGKDQKTQFLLDMMGTAAEAMAKYLKESDNVIDIKPEMREEILDGICDQIVTGTGVGYFLQMDVPGGFGEVNRSNFSKFGVDGEPKYDQNLKMVKGPNYFKPDLKQYI